MRTNGNSFPKLRSLHSDVFYKHALPLLLPLPIPIPSLKEVHVSSESMDSMLLAKAMIDSGLDNLSEHFEIRGHSTLCLPPHFAFDWDSYCLANYSSRQANHLEQGSNSVKTNTAATTSYWILSWQLYNTSLAILTRQILTGSSFFFKLKKNPQNFFKPSERELFVPLLSHSLSFKVCTLTSLV